MVANLFDPKQVQLSLYDRMVESGEILGYKVETIRHNFTFHPELRWDEKVVVSVVPKSKPRTINVDLSFINKENMDELNKFLRQ